MNVSIRHIMNTVLVLWFAVACGQDGIEYGPGDRQPAVAGSFYPAGKNALNNQLQSLFGLAAEESVNQSVNESANESANELANESASESGDKPMYKDIAAVIVPHAGYVFSGEVAAAAFSRIDPDRSFKRVFLIGTSHHMLLKGASIYNGNSYITPLGAVPVDTELANRLISDYKLFSYVPDAHDREHSIEVQLPFLQYHLKKPFTIVPVIIGTQHAGSCREIAEILQPFFTSENLFVVSSDFSHYPAYDDAVENDRHTGQAVSANSPEAFITAVVSDQHKDVPGLVTSCCGWSSVLTLLQITSQLDNIGVEHVKYMNSGDSPYGDRDRVVGYHAFVFGRNTKLALENPSTPTYQLSTHEKAILLKIAREAIESRLAGKPLPQIATDTLPAPLAAHCGAFVTLHLNGRLRGCIGQFTSTTPLCDVVQQMAIAAAFRDHRFQPVTLKEMNRIELEISVLTPLKKIHSIDEFRLGEQGIYIIHGSRTGTFLPQVAESTGWTKEEFLGHCARDKAGIGWDGWKTADLYTYEALVFDERQIHGKQ